MDATKTFLAVTDFSEGAWDAVRRAALLAAEQSGRLPVVRESNPFSEKKRFFGNTVLNPLEAYARRILAMAI